MSPNLHALAALLATAGCGFGYQTGDAGNLDAGHGSEGGADAAAPDGLGVRDGAGAGEAASFACRPLTCALLGFDCGPAGDGCGGALDCGTCEAPETCGGAGQFSRCGGHAGCVPKTCADLGFNCGPAGDGCGGALACGTCTVPDTCGGGGKSGVCGSTSTSADGGFDGGACMPLTCMAQGIGCGPAGDGCGGALDCGACSPGTTCGGGGLPATCGSPACTPKTCIELGFHCGPAGDGCGGSLECGTCPPGAARCGSGGAPGICGAACACK